MVALICARVYYVIFSWDYYSEHPAEIFSFRGGGLAIYGGVIGGVLTCLGYGKVKKLSYGLLVDTACLGLVLDRASAAGETSLTGKPSEGIPIICWPCGCLWTRCGLRR